MDGTLSMNGSSFSNSLNRRCLSATSSTSEQNDVHRGVNHIGISEAWNSSMHEVFNGSRLPAEIFEKK